MSLIVAFSFLALINISETSDNPLYRCLQCPREFWTKAQHNLHVRCHAGKRPCICHQCGALFTDPRSLKMHNLMYHSNHRQPKCNVCRMRFLTRGELTKHLPTHTGKRPHQCHLCPLQFARAWNLKVHLRSHTGEQPYKCTVCSRAYSQSSSLSRHVSKHNHYSSGEVAPWDTG